MCLTTVNGCDSTVNLDLTVNPIYTVNLIESICEGESISIGSSTYTVSGNYTDVLKTMNGCDSTVNLNLTVNPNYNVDISESICQGESITVGFNTYTTSGNYTDLLSSVNGCDSVVNLTLTVNPIYNVNISETICEGESVQIGSSNYTTSGVYTDILSTINGCDSVVNLTLMVHPVYNVNISETICEGESIQIGSSSYTTSGYYTDVLTTVNGCDSIINLALTVFEIEEETLSVELCFGESYNGVAYSADTTLVDTLISSVNCDSIVTTNITVNPVYDETVSIEICEGEEHEGTAYFSDATIVENLTTSNGCDSTVTTNISVIPNINNAVDINLCYGGIYEGTNYTSDTTLIDIYVSAEGCDSIVTTQILVEPEDVTNIVESICEGESYEVGGVGYSTTGNYTTILTNVNGCDSTVNLNLTVFEIKEEAVGVELCSGESYDGIVYTVDTALVDTFISFEGCDSIVTTNIIVNPVYDETLSIQVCEGAEYNGVTYFNDATVIENLVTSSGCDSTNTINISVVLTIQETVNVNLCPGEDYNGTTYFANTTLTNNYTSTGGCDSTVTTVITVEDIVAPVLIGTPGGDITVQCDGIPSAPIVSATDNCSAGLTVNYNEIVGTGCPYTIVRTWEVTDDEGNTTITTQTITVEDTVNPVLNGVPSDITVECDAIPSAPTITATDNCSSALVVNYNETIGTGCPYTITRTWETTDECANSVLETQIITVEDNTIPELINIPDDVVLECVDCFQSFANGDFEENPGIGGWAYLNAGDVPGWNTTGNTAMIEIQRSGSVDGVVSYSGNFHAELNSNAVGDFYQEFCTVPTTTLMISFAHHKRMNSGNTTDDIMGVYGGPDLNNLTLLGTFTATATSGWTVHTVSFSVPANQSTAIFLFRAIQGAPGNTTLGNLIDDITVVTLFETTLPSVQDNCDADIEVTVNNQVINGACANQMQLVRTWTAIDDCGNVAQDSQLVTIGDFIAPVLNNVPSDITVECDNIPGAPNVTATDNCSTDLTVNFNETIGTGCPYTITRTWDVTDDCGNTATATQTITVEDSTDPVLVDVPGNTTVECGAVPNAPLVTATDNCSVGLVVNYNETIGTGCPYTITRTWDVTDECGNTTTSTQTINVIDSTDPVLVGVPANITVECGAIPNAPIVTATDNCSTDLTVNYNETIGNGCPYVITRTWEVTDDCGNSTSATQILTVDDTTDPVLVNVPVDITVDCNSIPNAPIVTATDNCTVGLTVDYNETSGSGCFYTITRSWEVTDNCGNMTTAVQTITVEDVTPPVLLGVPADVTVDCNSIPGLPTVTANDNCSNILIVDYNETIGPGCPYNISRIWSVTDNCGNTTTSIQLITVEDTTNPVLVGAPSDITVECDAIPPAATLSATDNCDTNVDISFSEIITPGNCANTYTITRTWTAIDNCGNTDTESQIVSVVDNTIPILNGIPSDITVSCDNVPSAPIVTATDNCSTGLIVDFSESSGSGCQYSIIRTWTATDDCGNTISEFQTITVDDTANPVLTGVPADITVDCGAIPSVSTVSAIDDCANNLSVIFDEVIGSGCPFTITRTWSVTDDCGNPSSESQVIIVNDATAPVLSASPVDITVSCDNIPSPDVLTATDDCDNDVEIFYSESSTAGPCVDQYTLQRTWTAMDDCGNTATYSQNIEVIDCGPEILLTVLPNPAVCEGENVTISTNLTTGYPTPYYQWQFSDDNGATWSNLVGANSSTNSFNAYLPKAGLYRVVVANSAGDINNPDCNEVSNSIEIIVYPHSPVTQLNEEICDGEVFAVGANSYTTSGNYSDILTNINGCDSLVNLNLTVHPIYSEDITEVICEGENVQVGNNVYTTTGNYTDILTTVHGCDSVSKSKFKLFIQLTPKIFRRLYVKVKVCKLEIVFTR